MGRGQPSLRPGPLDPSSKSLAPFPSLPIHPLIFDPAEYKVLGPQVKERGCWSNTGLEASVLIPAGLWALGPGPTIVPEKEKGLQRGYLKACLDSGHPTTTQIHPHPSLAPPRSYNAAKSLLPQPCQAMPAQLRPSPVPRSPPTHPRKPQPSPNSIPPVPTSSPQAGAPNPPSHQESESPGSSGRGLWGRREAGAANAEGRELSPRKQAEDQAFCRHTSPPTLTATCTHGG